MILIWNATLRFMMILIVEIFWIWLHNVWYTFSPHMHKAHLYNDEKKWSTVGRIGRLCFRSSWERAVTDVRDRRQDELLNPTMPTARIPHADCFRSLSERVVGAAVDGRPWRAAGVDFWNKRHGFLTPIVSEVCQSGPLTASRDGLFGWWTFDTNGTDSSRR